MTLRQLYHRPRTHQSPQSGFFASTRSRTEVSDADVALAGPRLAGVVNHSLGNHEFMAQVALVEQSVATVRCSIIHDAQAALQAQLESAPASHEEHSQSSAHEY